MSHLSTSTEALVNRVRRIVGQMQGVERAIAGHEDCAKILHLAAAARGAMNGLMDELIEAHVHEHVAADGLTADARREGADALIAAIRRYAK